jgi:hypothetical protein
MYNDDLTSPTDTTKERERERERKVTAPNFRDGVQMGWVGHVTPASRRRLDVRIAILSLFFFLSLSWVHSAMCKK